MKFSPSITNSITSAFLGIVAVAALSLSARPALAQQAPPPYAVQPAPPAPPPTYATTEEHLSGRISSFDGKYQLQIRDDRGFIDNVTLHDGTIINPRGLRLSTGQSVTVLGHNAGKTFAANEIDTPYANYGVPVYGYPGYPYGPGPYAVGIGFRDRGFGFRGWF